MQFEKWEPEPQKLTVQSYIIPLFSMKQTKSLTHTHTKKKVVLLKTSANVKKREETEVMIV